MAQTTAATTKARVSVEQVGESLRWLVRNDVPFHESRGLLIGGLAFEMVRAAGGNSSKAARRFRVHRNSLDRILRKFSVAKQARAVRHQRRTAA